MALQHLRHHLHAALDISIDITRLLDEDGFANVKQIAVRVAVVIANGE